MEGVEALSGSRKEPDEPDDFMDLSAIGCSLLMEQLGASITVTGCEDATYQQQASSSFLGPAGRLHQGPPPPYPAGLTPFQTPYVSPYTTPFQTPSPSPHSSAKSSPANIKGPGIDEELARILDNDPSLWQHPPQQQTTSRTTPTQSNDAR